jgi:hypothetical protein
MHRILTAMLDTFLLADDGEFLADKPMTTRVK